MKAQFTVFAPPDEAFAKLPAGTVADLLTPEDKVKLTEILTYHVVPGSVMAAQVVTMNGKEAKTVNGQMVTIARRIQRLLARCGVSNGNNGMDVLDPWAGEAPMLWGRNVCESRRMGRWCWSCAVGGRRARRIWCLIRSNSWSDYGVLAPRAAWRSAIVPSEPKEEADAPDALAGCGHSERVGRRPSRAWAELMERRFGFDLLACPQRAGADDVGGADP